MITIKLDGVDRSTIIEFGSVNKTDAINQQTDTLAFVIYYHAGQTFRPEAGSEVEMYSGAEKIFGGKVYSVEKEYTEDNRVKYSVKCKDYSYDLARFLVVETYENMTVEAIIAAVIDDYTTGFTYVNTHCTLDVVKVTFNRITVVEVLNRLAEMTGFSWYPDYDKDIHFLEKNSEPATFNIDEFDGNFIPESLKASNNLSQIRNRVFIQGGEIEGEVRTELINGDNAKKQFKLSNKFAKTPTVEVGGVAKNVGIDYINDEDAFDCFWDYNQQYIRFKDSTIPPSGTNNISVTGIPLYNLTVEVEEPVSIAQYGVFEYSKTDKTIKSREAAISMAKAELEAYNAGLIEGSFTTYTPGLRSGQIINVKSTVLGIDEDFLIQRVGFKMKSINDYEWNVQLATLRTVGIVDFLIGLLKSGDRVIEDTGNTVLEKTVYPKETIKFGDAIGINTDDIPTPEVIEFGDVATVQPLDYEIEFVLAPLGAPVGNKRVFMMDVGLLS